MRYSISLSVVVALLSCDTVLTKPPLRVTVTVGQVRVDVRTLGEYPSSVRKLRLTGLPGQEVLWEVEAEGPVPQLWEIRLVEGENSTKIDEAVHGSYRVVEPSTSDTFFLEAGKDYRIEVWGEGPRRNSEVFSLP